MWFILGIVLFAVSSEVSSNQYERRYDLGDKPMYNLDLIEGDIVGYSKYRMGSKNGSRSAIISEWEIWPGGVIPFTLDSSVDSEKDAIFDAMEEYHKKTCIRFVPKDSSHEDWIHIGWHVGCWSLVGRNGGMQEMSLGTGCHWRGIIVHELGHAVGFNHEHQRSDRDDYVTIHFENIIPGLSYNFDKLKPYENNFLGENYDYNSIMQYESTSFSYDGVAITITPKDSSVTLIPVWEKGQLSEVDVRRVKKLYQCDGMVRPTPSPIPPFFCDFEHDDCGWINDFEESRWEREWATLGGRTGYVMQTDASKAKSVAARIITERMDTYRNTKVCLKMKYYTTGPGIYQLEVYMQHVNTDLLITLPTGDQQWHEYKQIVDLDVRDRYLKFFIMAIFIEDQPGIAAIDDLYMNLNDVNECY